MQTGRFTQPGAFAPDRKAPARGFAVILHESDFLDVRFRSALHRLDYHAYLIGLWQRMALARRAGMRVLIGPFLIDQHISFADRLDLAPFGTLALRKFDDFVTRTCPHTRDWRGEPPDFALPDLRAAVTAATASGRAPPRRRPRPHDLSTRN